MKSSTKYLVHLTEGERQALKQFVASGKKQARPITRAHILLLADAGQKNQAIADLLGVSIPTVSSMRKKYATQLYDDLVDLLPDAPRSGRPIQVDSRLEAQITMIACSQAPEGAARWTLHLIADRLVHLDWVESISHERVRLGVKKNHLKPWLKQQWCIGKITDDYLWHMEDVLYHYEQPYDPDWPLVCFDERPCFLLEEQGPILPMAPNQAKRHHYEYKKNGACCVLLAFEPHTGLRYVEVRDRRTAVDYAEFMHTLLEVYYPEAEGLRLVQDNLNTHKPGSQGNRIITVHVPIGSPNICGPTRP